MGGRGTSRGPLLWSQFKMKVTQSREVNSGICLHHTANHCCLFLVIWTTLAVSLCSPYLGIAASYANHALRCSRSFSVLFGESGNKVSILKSGIFLVNSPYFHLCFLYNTFVVTSITSFPLTGEHCLFNLDSLPCRWQRKLMFFLLFVMHLLLFIPFGFLVYLKIWVYIEHNLKKLWTNGWFL